MAETKARNLRVLIANEKRERLELLAQVVAGLGHEVIAREIGVKEVGDVTADRGFEMLRDHSQHNGHRIVDIAQTVVDSHLLIMPPLQEPEALSEQPA